MRRSKIIYNPYLSVQENAVNNKVSISAIRWYIRINGIDRKLDNAVVKKNKILALRKKEPNISIKEISMRLGCSVNTVKKYLQSENCLSNNDNNKLSTFDTTKQKFLIKTVSENQNEILSNILRLYVQTNTFDCDLTYSIGNFYKNIPSPHFKFDKFPQKEDVFPLSQISTIVEKNSLHSIAMDLPFIIRNVKKQNSKIDLRFSHFSSLKELFDTNKEMLQLSYELLRKNGYLIVKTMDFTYAYKQIWLSNFIQNEAFQIGYILEDIFILVTKTRMIRSNNMEQQRHARKYHSFFFVFRKK